MSMREKHTMMGGATLLPQLEGHWGPWWGPYHVNYHVNQ